MEEDRSAAAFLHIRETSTMASCENHIALEMNSNHHKQQLISDSVSCTHHICDTFLETEKQPSVALSQIHSKYPLVQNFRELVCLFVFQEIIKYNVGPAFKTFLMEVGLLRLDKQQFGLATQFILRFSPLKKKIWVLN